MSFALQRHGQSHEDGMDALHERDAVSQTSVDRIIVSPSILPLRRRVVGVPGTGLDGTKAVLC